MVKTKRRFTRAELMTPSCPGRPSQSGRCVLCKADVHDETCVFADASVTSVVVIASRARGVVLRIDATGRHWWWTSCGGSKYHIEKMPGRYAMFDAAGNEIVERHRLCDIRHYIALNQGRL